MAHSLGNMVVNSALQRTGPGLVDNYVMNEPAVAAEAFKDPSQPFAPGEADQAILDVVKQRYGYPDDTAWFNQWIQMVNGQPGGLFGPDFTDFNNWNARTGPLPTPRPFYYERWTQVRPPDGVPDNGPQDIHNHRGPWKGYFFTNIQKVSGNFVNTFSAGDSILGPVWTSAQDDQKPYSGFLGLGAGDVDSERKDQLWATLSDNPFQLNYGNEEALWSQVDRECELPQQNHYNTVRQWAELAFWFKALTRATGSGPVSSLTNYSFTAIGAVQNPLTTDLTKSHSYMTAKPFYEVKDGFIRFADSLKSPN